MISWASLNPSGVGLRPYDVMKPTMPPQGLTNSYVDMGFFWEPDDWLEPLCHCQCLERTGRANSTNLVVCWDCPPPLLLWLLGMLVSLVGIWMWWLVGQVRYSSA